MHSFFDLSHRVKRPNGFKHFFIAVLDKFVPIFGICAGYIHQFPADIDSRIKPLAPSDRAVVAETLSAVFEAALYLAKTAFAPFVLRDKHVAVRNDARRLNV